MHARFVSALLAGLAGGFVVVASQAFTPSTAGWIAFGIGLGLLVLAAVPSLAGDKGLVSRAIDAVLAAVSAWTVVASVVWTGTTLKWLTFAEGIAFAALALGGLILNQVQLTRKLRSAALSPATESFEALHSPINGSLSSASASRASVAA
jgi:hypothetical protein